jgi:hypothetical protein
MRPVIRHGNFVMRGTSSHFFPGPGLEDCRHGMHGSAVRRGRAFLLGRSGACQSARGRVQPAGSSCFVPGVPYRPTLKPSLTGSPTFAAAETQSWLDRAMVPFAEEATKL